VEIFLHNKNENKDDFKKNSINTSDKN